MREAGRIVSVDHASFGGIVVSLSLAADWPMHFRPRGVRPYERGRLASDEVVALPRRSALVLRSQARSSWMHGIDPAASTRQAETRVPEDEQKGTRDARYHRHSDLIAYRCCLRYRPLSDRYDRGTRPVQEPGGGLYSAGRGFAPPGSTKPADAVFALRVTIPGAFARSRSLRATLADPALEVRALPLHRLGRFAPIARSLTDPMRSRIAACRFAPPPLARDLFPVSTKPNFACMCGLRYHARLASVGRSLCSLRPPACAPAPASCGPRSCAPSCPARR